MHTNEPREDPLVDMGYEVRDVDYSKVRTAMLIFFGFGAACAIVGWFIYAYRYKFFAVNDGGPITNALKRRLPEFPNPELQNNVTTKTDIALMRQAEDARLHGYGYADKAQTRAYIPIERAMEMVAQNGIKPTGRSIPAISPGNQTGQNTMPTESVTSTTQPAPNKPGQGAGGDNQTTAGSIPGTGNGTRTVPVQGDPHASGTKPPTP
jgi:hypothetical protein